jgi:hypothetical protein
MDKNLKQAAPKNEHNSNLNYKYFQVISYKGEKATDVSNPINQKVSIFQSQDYTVKDILDILSLSCEADYYMGNLQLSLLMYISQNLIDESIIDLDENVLEDIFVGRNIAYNDYTELVEALENMPDALLRYRGYSSCLIHPSLLSFSTDELKQYAYKQWHQIGS